MEGSHHSSSWHLQACVLGAMVRTHFNRLGKKGAGGGVAPLQQLAPVERGPGSDGQQLVNRTRCSQPLAPAPMTNSAATPPPAAQPHFPNNRRLTRWSRWRGTVPTACSWAAWSTRLHSLPHQLPPVVGPPGWGRGTKCCSPEYTAAKCRLQ